MADASEFVQISNSIMKFSVDLKALKDSRDDLNSQISDIEKELLPLIAQHSKLLGEMVGIAATVPVVPSASNNPLVAVNPVNLNAPAITGVPANSPHKARIKDYLSRIGEEAVSATDVANSLNIDPSLVRECMRELLAGKR